MTLLGAYHDRTLRLEYVDVFRSVNRSSADFGDWQYNEVRLSEGDSVLTRSSLRVALCGWPEGLALRLVGV